MAAEHNLAGNFWGKNLINSDKSPSPLLEQLCLGIARTIATLEPNSTEHLVPQKLASFYKKVGGNYDPLFLSTPNAALSLIYRSIGCFHTLQPSTTPFETPSIPALLPVGFVRWQTVQILLDPDEHVPYLQAALKRFDIVNPTSGVTFPKVLPREAFSEKPDPEMTKWHDDVLRRLELDQQARKYRSSPLPSPHGDKDDYAGYFAKPHKGSHVRRPARPPGINSREQVSHTPDIRRSSLPDQNTEFLRNGDAKAAAAARHGFGYRSSNASNAPRASSVSRHGESSSSTQRSQYHHHRPGSSGGPRPSPPSNPMPPPPSQPQHRHRSSTTTSSPAHKHPPRSPIADVTGSSGSDASSENSVTQQSDKRKSSLFPPTAFFRHHLRRHSHDSSYIKDYKDDEVKPPLPPRPAIPQPKPVEYAPVQPPHAYHNGQGSNPRRKDSMYSQSPGGVQFREHLFDNDRRESGHSSAPDSPVKNSTIPRFRYFDPKGRGTADPNGNDPGTTLMKTRSDGEGLTDEYRKFGMPTRVNTVTGVGGRRYLPPKTAPPIAAGDAGGGAMGRRPWD